MSTEIYYFSGTGNSLHVAKELQKRIPETELIPIVSLLNNDIIKSSAKTVGIVFPVHALTIPIAVKKFLMKIDLNSAEYIFAIATRYGTIFRGFEKIDQILKKKNKHLNSHFILNMGHNEAPRAQKGYAVPSQRELSEIESVVQERLDSIEKIVVNKEISRENDSEYFIEFPYNRLFNFISEKLVLLGMSFSEYTGGVNYFCSDSKCNGCGTCEKICLSGKIKMVDGKPTWQKNVFCYMCFACVNLCPAESIQVDDIPFVKSYTRENGRYPHPYATAKDIAGQKRRDLNENRNYSPFINR
jgi:NAD-dependent dihydropyrimidine dehydrogenase PreA subunit/flavodoxin